MDVMTGHRDAVPDRTARPMLRWSPAWVLEPAGPTVARPSHRERATTLVLSAGADRRVAIDGVDPDQRAAVERWSAGGAIVVEPGEASGAGETGRAGGAGEVGGASRVGETARTVGAGGTGETARTVGAVGAGEAGEAGRTGETGRTDETGGAVGTGETVDASRVGRAGSRLGARRDDGAGGAARTRDARRQAVARLLDRLVELGAVVPVAPPGPPTVLASDAATAGELRDLLTEGGTSGAVLALRTGTAWPEVPPGRLHLGVDLSLHHTVVLGPLVIPGASACLACLDARIARRWPPPAVPAEPAVRRLLPVVAALLDVQLELIARGASPLVNATMSWNLETGTTDRQSLYKLAGCGRCDTGPGDGRVALPWGAAL